MQQQLARSGVMPTCVTRFAKAVSIVRSWWLFQLPRAARLRKNGPEWAGRGRHSGSRMHADAPEAAALLGNAIALDRLRWWPMDDSDGKDVN